MTINISKKQKVALILGAVFVVGTLLIIFIYLPILNESQKLIYKSLEVGENVQGVKNILKIQSQKERVGRLINYDGVALALNEITSVGQKNQINFILIRPKDVQKMESFEYNQLPIQINLESTYKNLGRFLRDLEQLKESFVFVKSFRVKRDENILPLIKTNMVIEVLLKDG